jgi:mono/diheme cytochrome c family protein
MRTLLLVSVLLAVVLVSCTSPGNTASSLPGGDASRGAVLFTQAVNGTPPCSTCHSVDASQLSGPNLQGFAAAAGTRIKGTSARDYAYESIVRPAAHLVSGYGNLMYNQYGQRLNAQQIADLIAYLLTL